MNPENETDQTRYDTDWITQPIPHHDTDYSFTNTTSFHKIMEGFYRSNSMKEANAMANRTK